MVAYPAEKGRKLEAVVSSLDAERQPFVAAWKELADYYIPRRYIWLGTSSATRVQSVRNNMILDSTGTDAAKTLAAGMLNGITSPSRPWFKLRIPSADSENKPIRAWLDECERRMLTTMAETNFYNAMGIVYLDLAVFGTAAALIHEDAKSVFRCYNPAVGEYFLANDERLVVGTFAREFVRTVEQLVDEFGIENCSETVRVAYERGAEQLSLPITVRHLIQKNRGEVAKQFDFVEFYWEANKANSGKLLRMKGFFELPGIFPRWETVANDPYGIGPAADAIGDVIQLQHQTKTKGQGLDKMVKPPVQADISLKGQPTALMPNGVTYVPGLAAGNTAGVKAVYNVQLPLDQLTADIREVQGRVRKTFYNDLFQMISQLDTVRSATEIIERREEKLILLGAVLERFENEALDPAINRIFNIMLRAGLLPEPPEDIQEHPIEIQYVSILSTAQRAVGTVPTERFLGIVGNLAAVKPEVLDIPDFDYLLRAYARDIGVPALGVFSLEEIKASREAKQMGQGIAGAAQTAGDLAGAAKLMSETQVGGGANALQALLGG